MAERHYERYITQVRLNEEAEARLELENQQNNEANVNPSVDSDTLP